MIREATAADQSAVTALWEVCGLTRPWNDPVADFTRALGFDGSTVFVVEVDGLIVASAMTGYDGHRGWVYYLAVAPEHRQQGLARQLLTACEVWLAALGCPKVELMVRDGNPDAAVYEKLGWEAQPVRVFARCIAKRDA
ncbi:GNAT family acetyltransferase [Altererythrobacter salegens]|uniref:GNAT family acetyltransferase n=1 Tax=Croceibacterium salegens TaxID=1737568 RepID=A0A6I4SUU9_9SPHN|nr:GNAT family acetyltransferase [Croceibacterium salegens]MXO59643.1 GNAT family acetyltransferase [Croceibacterium salegens]